MIDYIFLAENYDSQYMSDMCKKENTAVSELLNKYEVQNKKVVDVGCGTGFALDLADIKNYTGIDISPRMIEKACCKHPNANFIVSSAKEALFQKEYDVALSLFSIPYIGEDAVKRIHSILKNDGICICVYYNKPFLNSQSVYFGQKEQYLKSILPQVKNVILAFFERFRCIEYHPLTEDETYSVAVFRKETL